MVHEQPSRVFGFPEFWPTVVAEYPEFFARMGKLVVSLNSLTLRSHEHLNRQQLLLVDMLMLVGYGFNEVITLVGNGMGLGAMKVVRNVVEIAINARYIGLFPEQAEKYLGWYWVEKHKLYRRLQKQPLLIKQISKAEVNRAEEEYKRIKHLFSYSMTNRNGQVETKTQKHWCSEDMYNRADKSGPELNRIYMTVIPLANKILHGSVEGLLWHVNAGNGSDRLEKIPSLKCTDIALSATHAALIKTLETVAQVLDVAPKPDIEVLTFDYKAIWDAKPLQGVIYA